MYNSIQLPFLSHFFSKDDFYHLYYCNCQRTGEKLTFKTKIQQLVGNYVRLQIYVSTIRFHATTEQYLLRNN